jgi:hypothetical protein
VVAHCRCLLLVAIASLVAVSGTGLCVAASSPPGPQSEGEVMEEVLVRGTRLYELRAAIVAVEDKFYSRYNDLNTIDDFDIACNRVQLTGTKFKKRRCAPRLLDKVLASDARETLEAMQDGRQKRGEDPDAVLARHSGEYKQNMLRILRSDSQLRALVQERDKAQVRYDTEHKKRMKGRLVLGDWSDQK